MLAQTPGVEAQGRGPADGKQPSRHDYHHPAAALGRRALASARCSGARASRSRAPRAVLRMNHEDKGFDCPGCAWPDDQKGLHLDICENGIKHVTWEMTRKQVGADFFAAHTVTELERWSDFALEDQGRLTEPMSYDADDATRTCRSRGTTRSRSSATRCAASTSPNQASFYTSGRLGNEATFLYQLWVREFGTNNLPDCSNMCHEASGRALTASLGTGKGTVRPDDWEQADADLRDRRQRRLERAADAHRARRGVRARRAASCTSTRSSRRPSRRTIVPHDFVEMATLRADADRHARTSSRASAATWRSCAASPRPCSRRPDATRRARPRVHRRATRTGLRGVPRAVRRDAVGRARAAVRRRRGDDAQASRGSTSSASATIIAWCLGVTQQEHGVDTVREIVNLLLLRGNIGRAGAGPVADPRALERPGQPHLRHRPPAEAGVPRQARPRSAASTRRASTASTRCGTIEAMQRGEVKVFVGMGGNFALAAPDTALTIEALRRCELTVQVSTKLNRSHLVHGRSALILPCLGRDREGPPARRLAGHVTRRGRDEHGAPLPRHEGARLAAPALRAGDHRRAWRWRRLPGHEDAVGGLRRRLRPHPRHDGEGARRLRRTSTAGAPAARLPHPAAGARARVPHAVGPRRVLARAAARRRPARRHA